MLFLFAFFSSQTFQEHKQKQGSKLFMEPVMKSVLFSLY